MAEQGIIFAATGAQYRALARRAARNVRALMPEVEIDLFTDSPLEDPVFDQVHLVDARGPRPKMEALRHSRFRLTLYLDADVVMVAPVWDVFEVIAAHDLVGAHEMYGSSRVALTQVRKPIPPAFRQINSGVLGIRKCPETEAFLAKWQEDFQSLKLQFDQPLLRELLFESDLRIAVLPGEYNQMFSPFIEVADGQMMAPRLLHLTHLHNDLAHGEPADQPFEPAALMPPRVVERINALLASDRTLGNPPSLRTRAVDTLRRAPWLHRVLVRIWTLLR